MYPSILVPTDGSACSEKAVEHAVAIAKGLGSRVTFLFVMDLARNYQEGVMGEVQKTLADEGERVLARAREVASRAGVRAEAELVPGDPADTIVHRAEDFDLIVMGRYGKGLWQRLTVGSVSQGVLRRATRPLLLVPFAEAVSAD